MPRQWLIMDRYHRLLHLIHFLLEANLRKCHGLLQFHHLLLLGRHGRLLHGLLHDALLLILAQCHDEANVAIDGYEATDAYEAIDAYEASDAYEALEPTWQRHAHVDSY